MGFVYKTISIIVKRLTRSDIHMVSAVNNSKEVNILEDAKNVLIFIKLQYFLVVNFIKFKKLILVLQENILVIVKHKFVYICILK